MQLLTGRLCPVPPVLPRYTLFSLLSFSSDYTASLWTSHSLPGVCPLNEFISIKANCSLSFPLFFCYCCNSSSRVLSDLLWPCSHLSVYNLCVCRRTKHGIGGRKKSDKEIQWCLTGMKLNASHNITLCELAWLLWLFTPCVYVCPSEGIQVYMCHRVAVMKQRECVCVCCSSLCIAQNIIKLFDWAECVNVCFTARSYSEFRYFILPSRRSTHAFSQTRTQNIAYGNNGPSAYPAVFCMCAYYSWLFWVHIGNFTDSQTVCLK